MVRRLERENDLKAISDVFTDAGKIGRLREQKRMVDDFLLYRAGGIW
jgi:hypothetical protein